jgi:hypothetical protein
MNAATHPGAGAMSAISRALPAVTAVALLSGCGGGHTSPTPAPSATAAPTAASTAGPSTAPQAATQCAVSGHGSGVYANETYTAVTTGNAACDAWIKGSPQDGAHLVAVPSGSPLCSVSAYGATWQLYGPPSMAAFCGRSQ